MKEREKERKIEKRKETTGELQRIQRSLSTLRQMTLTSIQSDRVVAPPQLCFLSTSIWCLFVGVTMSADWIVTGRNSLNRIEMLTLTPWSSVINVSV